MEPSQVQLLRGILAVLGLVCGAFAAVGVMRGSIHVKGRHYSRQSEPVRFWVGVFGYGCWTVMLLFFAFAGKFN